MDLSHCLGEDNVKRLMLVGLLGGLLASNTGCGLFRAAFCYRPCVSRGDCGPCTDDGACGDGCGSCGVVARHRGCGGCGTCGECDPCADPCGSGCYARPWHRGPLSCVFALFNPETWCGGGCGERYWGDFYNDPPDCQDPCDGYGNYAGGGCRTCGGSTSGYTTARAKGGCRSCGGGGNVDSVEEYSDGSVSRRMPTSTNRTASRTYRSNTPPNDEPHMAARP